MLRVRGREWNRVSRERKRIRKGNEMRESEQRMRGEEFGFRYERRERGRSK